MIRIYCRLVLMIGVVFLVAVILFGCKAADEQRGAAPPTVTISQPIQRDVTR